MEQNTGPETSKCRAKHVSLVAGYPGGDDFLIRVESEMVIVIISVN